MNLKAISISVLAALSSAYADEGAVAEADVGEYRTIIDRQMFGPLPDAFDPQKPPGQGVAETRGKDEVQLSKEQEQIQKSVHFSVINRTPAGECFVGFTDNSNQREPRHYYMKIGESRDGWLVKAADASTETMTLSKDGIEVTMKLGDKSGQASVPATMNASASSISSPRGDAAPAGVSGRRLLGARRGMSLRARRLEAQQKAEEERQKAEAAAKAKEDERRKFEEAEREERRNAEQAEREKQIKAELTKMQEMIRQSLKSAQPGGQANENNDAQ